MNLAYKNGDLKLGEHRLRDLCLQRSEPFYVYDLSHIQRRVRSFKAAFTLPKLRMFYAVKANAHPQILRLIQQEGCGVDVVSGGEIRLALDNGFRGEDIIFSGVGKTEKELVYALSNGIHQINVESIPELERVARLAAGLGIQAAVALRLNPHVNPQTHPYITTGLRENKFGIDVAELPTLERILESQASRLFLRGLTLHIGSQLLDVAPLQEAIEKILPLYESLQRKGFAMTSLDVGGGLGIDYLQGDEAVEHKLLADYGRVVSQLVTPLVEKTGAGVYFEPGRFLVAHAGVLLAQVQYVKRTPYKNFLIVNTGMHHLMRPSLYQAFHRILPVTEAGDEFELYDVVGPICESADVVGRDRRLPRMQEGDWIAIADTGAYGRVMASHYNAHELPEEVAL